jgi:hypothetical protein
MSDVYLFLIIFLILIVGLILYVSLDFQMESGKRDGVLTGFFMRRPSPVELIIQVTMTGGISAIAFMMAVVASDVDPVLAIDALLLSFITLISFGYAIHRRMRHFREYLSGETDMSPGATLETLEPILYARVIIGTWILSVIILIVALLLPDVEQLDIISQVMFHYGVGGTLFIFSPMLFSVCTLMKKRSEPHDNV